MINITQDKKKFFHIFTIELRALASEIEVLNWGLLCQLHYEF